MSLNVLVNGPGVGIAKSLDIIRKSGMQVFENENKGRQAMTQSQTNFVNDEADQIVESYDQQGKQVLYQGISGLVGSVTGTMATAGFEGKSLYSANEAQHYETAQANLKVFNSLQPDGQLIGLGTQKMAIQPTSNGSRLALSGFLKADSPQLQQSSVDFRRDAEVHALKSMEIERKISPQFSSEKPQLEAEETDLERGLQQKIEYYKKDADSSRTYGNVLSNLCSNTVGGGFSISQQEMKKEEGDADAAKTRFEFALQLAKQASDMCNAGCQSALQNMQTYIQAESTNYNNAGYKN